MPELPEVETIARGLRSLVIGRMVRDLWCNWPRILSLALPALRRRMAGATLADLRRRGKYLVWDFGPAGLLLIHLRMSGRPLFLPAPAPPGRHVHFIIRWAGGAELHLDDARKFARIAWCLDESALSGRLGIEPLSPAFTPRALADLLHSRARRLKPALLDQRIVAGLGNIYTDEALWRAGLHPLRTTDSLRPDDCRRLHAAIRAALRLGIRHNGATLDAVYPGGDMQDHFAAYGRTGRPCARCGTPIRRLVVAQRGTHICPRCQLPPRRRRLGRARIVA